MIDACRKHGVWLDAGEPKRLAQYLQGPNAAPRDKSTAPSAPNEYKLPPERSRPVVNDDSWAVGILIELVDFFSDILFD